MSDNRKLAPLAPTPGPLSWIVFGGAFVAALELALQLLSGVAPGSPYAPVEITNDLLAACGLAWSALQVRTHWRAPDARRRWVWVCVGWIIISLLDDAERLTLVAAHPAASFAVSVVFWCFAAATFFACGRRYAMRRSAMAALRIGLLAQVAVHVLIAIELGRAAAFTQPSELLDLMIETGETAALFAYIAGLLLTQLAPLNTYGGHDAAVGREGRRAFHDLVLRPKPRYPTPYAALLFPVANQLVTTAMIAWFGGRIASTVRRETGRPIWMQFADLAWFGFVKRIDPVAYYLLELYRPERAADVDAVVTRGETKNGLTSLLQRACGQPGFPREMTDKLAFAAICRRHGLPTVPILASVADGVIIKLAEPPAFDRDLFAKEQRGLGGKRALRFDRVGSFDYVANGEKTLGFEAMLQRFAVLSGRRSVLLQPALANHPEIASLATTSLIVFRVVTCLDAGGVPRLTHSVMRIMAKFEPDWPHAPDSEWGANVDPATGRLSALTGDKPESCCVWRSWHPITGEAVEGRTISGWPEIAALALAAHGVFRGRLLVGWDIAWTPEGPVLLEGNSNMDFTFIQRCARTPVGRSPLAPLLNAALKRTAANRLTSLATPVLASGELGDT